MYRSESIDYTKLRKKSANLFFGVLTEKISIREALLQFPKDCEDKTIIAAWHALCHLEADEDIRKRDPEYKKVQDKYIEFIAFTLRDGNSLPKNIINEYIPYHSEVLIPCSNTIKGIIYKFKKFLNC
jgi:hypothetical protein